MGEWVQGIFGCFENCGLSLMAFFCPCVVFGRNAESLGESCLICGCCYLTGVFGYAAQVALRTRLRDRRGIEGTLLSDMVWIFLCPCCALVQEGSEIKAMQGAMAQDMERA